MIRYMNCFEVPEGRDDDFLRLFGAVNEHMVRQPGYIGHRLHRAVTSGARFRFVNYVEWESVDDWRRATARTSVAS
jgi:heme-degrading monooxygenase HmoA